MWVGVVFDLDNYANAFLGRLVPDVPDAHNDLFVDATEYAETQEGLSPRPNFDDLSMGFTSIFAIAIGDDWNYLMAMAYRAEGMLAILFYPVVFIFMNLVLLNLFLAILLQNFDEKEEPEKDKNEEREEKTMARV